MPIAISLKTYLFLNNLAYPPEVFPKRAMIYQYRTIENRADPVHVVISGPYPVNVSGQLSEHHKKKRNTSEVQLKY